MVEPPEGDSGMSLVFVTVPEPKQGKNRIHLDLASASLEAQQEMVTRLVALGASRVDVGRGRSPGWYWPTPKATSSACSLHAEGARRPSGVLRWCAPGFVPYTDRRT